MAGIYRYYTPKHQRENMKTYQKYCENKNFKKMHYERNGEKYNNKNN